MLIRSLRNFSHRYYNELSDICDLSEPHLGEITMQTGDVRSYDYDTHTWPESITLNASINPIKISDNNSIISRFKDNQHKWEMHIYDRPRLLENSPVSYDSIVKKITIKYEKSGSYILNQTKIEFFGNTLKNYQLNLDADKIFEKDFATTDKNIMENSTDDGIILGDNKISVCNLYPYGGFYTYGCHPRQIESCIFRAQIVDGLLGIKIHSLSSIQNFDPLIDTALESGKIIHGVNNLNKLQKKSLYDDLTQGACCIQLLRENKMQNYRSNGVIHIANTNLLIINFTKEK